MRKFLLFIASLTLLGTWTAFGYHEGVIAGIKKVHLPMIIDPATGTLTPLKGGPQLYCLDSESNPSPCANYAQTPKGDKILLVPESVLDETDPTPTPTPKAPPAPSQKPK